MSWDNPEASLKNLETAKRLIADTELTKFISVISVHEVMSDKSEPFDTSKAIESFKRFVNQLYCD